LKVNYYSSLEKWCISRNGMLAMVIGRNGLKSEF
jgi:hypothetical protein